MTWRDYHEGTKHSPESLRRSAHFLDWANMPEPFRHYEDVPMLDLPADPPSPEIPLLKLMGGACGATSATNGAEFLSQLLFYSAAVSASKRVPSTGSKYALRVNPSSGNLHPTEFHFITRGLTDWPDGLYHYRPSSHMAEQRARGEFSPKLAGGQAAIVFILTSIGWREAWKYRERAYRYCLHDVGHAWQALALAARAIGCDSSAIGHFCDDEIARLCGLNGDEWPMLLVSLTGASLPLHARETEDTAWFGGRANRLSREIIDYPLIDEMHALTKLKEGVLTLPATSAAEPRGTGEIKLPAPATSMRPFGQIARKRRSALDFVGNASMTFAQLSAILSGIAPRFRADFAGARLVQLYLYIHRVEGLAPGVYRHWPESGELEQIKAGDQRVVAAGLSLRQDLAGNACFAVSMIAGLEAAARLYGERGYRYAHFEAGAIGQRLYLAAEALGLAATGIGAFFDDEVDRYLRLSPGESVIYHFAIGHAVRDPRLEA